MSRSKLAAIPVLILACVLTVACGETQQEKNTQTVQGLLGSDGSGSWQQVKTNSRINGYAVFLGPDGKYYAFDVLKYQQGMTKDQFLAAATVYSGLVKGEDVYQQYGEVGSEDYTSGYCPFGGGDETISCTEVDDAYGNFEYYDVYEVDYGYYTVTEDIYTDRGSGLVFELGDKSSKDLAAVSGAISQQSVAAIRDSLISSYGLSQDRAAELASLAQSWQNISKTRTMTQKDMLEAQSKVFGTTLDKVAAAAKAKAQGNSSAYDSIVSKAADMNGLSPETANNILQGFVQQ